MKYRPESIKESLQLVLFLVVFYEVIKEANKIIQQVKNEKPAK